MTDEQTPSRARISKVTVITAVLLLITSVLMAINLTTTLYLRTHPTHPVVPVVPCTEPAPQLRKVSA